MLKYIGLCIIVGVVAIWAIYNFKTSHIQHLNVEHCDKSFYRAVKELNDLVQEKKFNRPFYEVAINGPKYSCIFVSYYLEGHVLSYGTEPFSGWVGNAIVTPDQLNKMADTLSENNTVSSISYFFSKFSKPDSSMHIPTDIAY